MKLATRDAVALAGCLAGLGVAGGFAFVALESYSGSPTAVAAVTVRIDQPPTPATVAVRTVNAVHFGAGVSPSVVPAGTLLAVEPGAASVPPGLPVGTMLRCDLRAAPSADGSPVLDVVGCSVAPPANSRP